MHPQLLSNSSRSTCSAFSRPQEDLTNRMRFSGDVSSPQLMGSIDVRDPSLSPHILLSAEQEAELITLRKSSRSVNITAPADLLDDHKSGAKLMEM